MSTFIVAFIILMLVGAGMAIGEEGRGRQEGEAPPPQRAGTTGRPSPRRPPSKASNAS